MRATLQGARGVHSLHFLLPWLCRVQRVRLGTAPERRFLACGAGGGATRIGLAFIKNVNGRQSIITATLTGGVDGIAGRKSDENVTSILTAISKSEYVHFVID